jgi:hypothetical protein
MAGSDRTRSPEGTRRGYFMPVLKPSGSKGEPYLSRLSASSLVFCLNVTMLPGRRLTASSNAARATR